MERREQRIVERRHDQQDEVGAGSPGLVDLVGVDDEVLAQQRGVDRGADGAQIGQAAAETPFFGEDADGAGTTTCVGPGQDRGVGDVGQLALAGAATLDLGDHADPGGAEVRHRIARGGSGSRCLSDRPVVHQLAARSHVDPDTRDDVVEHCHALHSPF